MQLKDADNLHSATKIENILTDEEVALFNVLQGSAAFPTARGGVKKDSQQNDASP